MIAAQSRPGNAGLRHEARHFARLAAVQALYQMELTGDDAESVAQDFLAHRLEREPELTAAGEPDADFFRAIVCGVPRHQEEIDCAVALCLSADWRLGRIDSILRAILRAAAFEFIGRRDVPARVAIDEYVEIARAFSASEETSFVNAVLDRMARQKRADEFGEMRSGNELEL